MKSMNAVAPTNPLIIKIFATGGTFEKAYNEISQTIEFGKTHWPEILEKGKCTVDCSVETIMMIDSLDMNDKHREKICAACEQTPEDRIIITHGTDTMHRTAEYLNEKKSLEGKTIIVTGAMIPYSFGYSDALFNMGAVVAYVQTMAPGVYISMNGKIFEAGKVRKNHEKGIFEAV
jgi:L-asparaginase